MNVLAFDIGTNLGWANWSDGHVMSGAFCCGKKPPRVQKYLNFKHFVRDLIADYKPDVIAYEDVKRHIGTSAAHMYGGYLAILEMESEISGCRMVGYAVGTIKKHATGSGRAQKQEMIDAANKMWPDELDKKKPNDNQADALWIMDIAVKNL